MPRILANLAPAWKIPLITGLSVRLALMVWGLFSCGLGIPAEVMNRMQVYYYGVPPVTEGISGALWGVWQRWDAIQYMRIAQSGYTHVELSAFFPLYPALAGLLSALSGVHILAALSLISLVATLLVMHLLYRLVAEFIHPNWATPSVLMLAFFPSSFFFFAPYPQSFGLFLLLLALFSALKQRWLVAACR